jgi:hypothetical protein
MERNVSSSLQCAEITNLLGFLLLGPSSSPVGSRGLFLSLMVGISSREGLDELSVTFAVDVRG